MSFLRSRHEQLADHLRSLIARGQLREPLPNTRDWAGQLGVSCATLYETLKTLKRERLILIEPRKGIRLNPHRRATSARGTKTVRIVYRGVDYPEFIAYSHWCGLLSQRLQAHGIQLSIEKCTDARLRSLSRSSRAGATGDELLFLLSLSESYQQLLARSGQPALVVGYRAPQVTLPFVTVDLEGGIRHAAHALLRRGFNSVHLLVNRVNTHAIERQRAAFRTACADWPHQPVHGEVVAVPLVADAQLSALQRFAARLRGRHGVLVVSPVSIAAAMTVLLGRGIAIPRQVEVVVIHSTLATTVVWPPPVEYAASVDSFVRALTRAAVHFFETGAVPPVEKILPLEVVPLKKAGALRPPAHW